MSIVKRVLVMLAIGFLFLSLSPIVNADDSEEISNQEKGLAGETNVANLASNIVTGVSAKGKELIGQAVDALGLKSVVDAGSIALRNLGEIDGTKLVGNLLTGNIGGAYVGVLTDIHDGEIGNYNNSYWDKLGDRSQEFIRQACENPNTTRESRLCESARRHIAETIEDNLQREAEIAYLKANLNAGATLVDFAIGPKVPNVLGTAAKAADSILAARSMSNGYTAYRNFQRLQTTIGTAYEAVSAAGAVNSVVSVANDFVEVQRRNAQVDAAKQFRQDHLPPTSNQGTSATPALPQIDPVSEIPRNSHNAGADASSHNSKIDQINANGRDWMVVDRRSPISSNSRPPHSAEGEAGDGSAEVPPEVEVPDEVEVPREVLENAPTWEDIEQFEAFLEASFSQSSSTVRSEDTYEEEDTDLGPDSDEPDYNDPPGFEDTKQMEDFLSSF